ncbi:hypothetical protein BX659_101227 [Orenia metallireducens]|uniref:LPS-assembly protein LptD n=1 Tax=Orenia metallireducens TaxID=1413210 RepID=UPI000D06028E|nr:LPS-assembly protein LptD [Orenia metallireducens]PRX35733.1 hypothetical protein BX659_101227 [Orenia metallireducens]
MRRIKLNILKVVLIVIVVVLFTPHSFAESNKGKLTADRVQYYREQELIIATGHAKLVVDDVEISSSSMEIDLKSNMLNAEGKVHLKNEDGEFDSKELEYNIKTKEGIFIESEGIIVTEESQDPIYVKSAKTEYSNDQTKIVDSEFTTCDLEEPHYHMSSTSTVIYPGDKLIAYNVVLWEFNGKVPILYFPIVVYSFKDKKPMEVEVGNNKDRGWFIKTTHHYYLNSHYDNPVLNMLAGDFGQYYIDGYSKSGFAGGFKHAYRTLEDDHAYLYFYLDQDKQRSEQSPWITMELNREQKFNGGRDKREQNLEYRNYYNSSWTRREQGLYLDYDFDQDLALENWDTRVGLDYNKDKTHDNRIILNSYFDKLRNKSTDDYIGLDVYYDLDDKESGRFDSEADINFDYQHKFLSEEKSDDTLKIDLDYNREKDRYQGEDEIKNEYGSNFNYRGYIKRKENIRDDYYNIDLSYDRIDRSNWTSYYAYNDRLQKYQIDLKQYKRYFTNTLYLDYDLDYKYYQYVDYDDSQRDGDAFEYLTTLKLAENKRIYEWFIETELKEGDIREPSRSNNINDSLTETEHYNLPKAEFTLKPGRIWDAKILDPLEVSAGGVRRYYYKWKDDPYPIKEHGYYKLDYSDYWRINNSNRLRYKEQLQQDIYSTNQQRFSYDSQLVLQTNFLKNWENRLEHNYRMTQGEVMEGFEEAEEDEHNIEWELDWRKNQSRFKVETGYDLLAEAGEEYDPLKVTFDYLLNDNYTIKNNIRYDLNEMRFDKIDTSIIVDYLNFDYQLDLYYYYDKVDDKLNGKWDTELDWTFGEKDWEWTIKLEGSYDFEDGEYDKANFSVEKMLHCRRVIFSYDYMEEEIAFKYQILSFPNHAFGIKSEKGQVSVGDGNLGGVLDEEN